MGSYLTNPSAPTPTDVVRRLIGDTTAPFAMTDADIGLLLTDWPNPYKCAAACCTALAAQYSALVTKSTGRMSIDLSDRSKAYAARAIELAALRRGTGTIGIKVGGQLRTQVHTMRQNPAWVQPSFWAGQFDFYTTRDPNWWWGYGTVGVDLDLSQQANFWEGGWPW